MLGGTRYSSPSTANRCPSVASGDANSRIFTEEYRGTWGCAVTTRLPPPQWKRRARGVVVVRAGKDKGKKSEAKGVGGPRKRKEMSLSSYTSVHHISLATFHHFSLRSKSRIESGKGGQRNLEAVVSLDGFTHIHDNNRDDRRRSRCTQSAVVTRMSNALPADFLQQRRKKRMGSVIKQCTRSTVPQPPQL